MDINGKKLINNLNEDYCSFEISKLLKEKGFNILCPSVINPFTKHLHRNDSGVMNSSSNGYLLCPTHALAIKWIRENFGVHVRTDRQPIMKNKFEYFYEIKSGDGFDTEPIYSGTFKSPEEATEAALRYTLENLV